MIGREMRCSPTGQSTARSRTLALVVPCIVSFDDPWVLDRADLDVESVADSDSRWVKRSNSRALLFRYTLVLPTDMHFRTGREEQPVWASSRRTNSGEAISARAVGQEALECEDSIFAVGDSRPFGRGSGRYETLGELSWRDYVRVQRTADARARCSGFTGLHLKSMSCTSG